MTTSQSDDHFTREVRAGMARYGIRPKELAPVLGISTDSLRRRLRGDSPFSHTHVTKLSEVLHIPITELFENSDR